MKLCVVPGPEKELDFTGTADALCKHIGINPETVIIVRNGTLITREDTVEEKDLITLLSIVSGG